MFKSLRVKTDSEKTDPGFGDIFISQLNGDDATNSCMRHPNCPARNVCPICKTQGSMTYVRKQKDQ